jgi:hypothetical protein
MYSNWSLPCPYYQYQHAAHSQVAGHRPGLGEGEDKLVNFERKEMISSVPWIVADNTPGPPTMTLANELM